MQTKPTSDHPLKIGDIVPVLNSTMGGKTFKEGDAEIVSYVSGRRDTYNVKFAGEDGTFVRFIRL